MTVLPSQPKIRPLVAVDVTALHDLADKGPMHCDCESNAELCHCSTIMMVCDEWATLTARAEELEKALQKIADLPERDNLQTPLRRTPRQIAIAVLQPKGAV